MASADHPFPQVEKQDATLQQTRIAMLEWCEGVGTFNSNVTQRNGKRDAENDAVGIASEIATADSLVRIVKAVVGGDCIRGP